MINNKYLISKLAKEVEELQKIIKYREVYNVRNFFMSCLIKSRIAFDQVLPFIITGWLVASLNSSSGNTPFMVDDSVRRVYVKTIDTSSGVHLKHFSYDISYDDELIEYSTGWNINENGLFERTVTSYRISKELDLSDVDSILSMTKEELEDVLVITNIKTIRKNAIDPDDEIYMDDAIIIVNHYDYIDRSSNRLHFVKCKFEDLPSTAKDVSIFIDDNIIYFVDNDTIPNHYDYIDRSIGIKESEIENITKTILYIIQSLCLGYAYKKGCSVVIKTSFSDKLRRYKLKYKIISEDELESLYKILEVKKRNLDMINGSDKKDNNYCRLRKR